ncbi:GTPase/DUF3482 domain-containing protein [Variovorax ginsengisoli]|uniref:G domain-containing protein n=1 Tax=Variovorax ginsengisoli TaxID=363844 RepID=A0ABT9S584_9BURK|nr:GTPase/DUF3482 domain-containing protein [Variovorax ginsengisoli]MDP9898906.1 hypothetical protein [Variovorax ginsengisoli]
MTTTAPILIAVVGHTNAGKTSLLRTLTRRVDFGEVAPRPGTTRHVESVDLQCDGRTALRFFDTPGLEDAVSLRAHLQAFGESGHKGDGEEGATTPPERIRRFLRSPEARGDFEQEAKVLRTLLDADAAFLVIDVREAVLPKFRDEIELIGGCGKPVLPVLNFVRDAQARTADWQALLAAYGLHAVVRFDAAAPFVGAERDLYQDLVTLLRHRRADLEAVVRHLAHEAQSRDTAAATRIARLLIDVASLRRLLPAGSASAGASREAAVAALRQEVFAQAQRCADDLLSLYGFREGDAGEARLPAVEGRWSMDFFSPEAMKDAGIRLGKGAAVGAAVGAAADLAVAGLSLGAGVALGGAIGGALAQGWGPLGRKLLHRLRDIRELSVEDAILGVLLVWQLRLAHALARRGHAAAGQPVAEDAHFSVPPHALADVLRAVQPARSHPEWAITKGGILGARQNQHADLEKADLLHIVTQAIQSITKCGMQPPV